MKVGVLHRDAIRAFAKKCGNNYALMESIVEKRLNLPPENEEHLDPENFSFKEIADALGGDVQPYSAAPVFSEAVSASQFNTLVGTLLSKKIMDSYTPTTPVIDQLVSKFTSNLETDTIPGGYLNAPFVSVGEGAEYAHVADVKEKYVTITHDKRGVILDVTDEAIRFDRTGIVLREAGKMGELMGRDRESTGMKVIQDASGYEAWYPSGSQEGLYANAAASTNHTYDNLVTDVLTDYTDLEALDALLGVIKDENGNPINVDPKILLVPRALKTTAMMIVENVFLYDGTTAQPSIRNPFANRFKVLSHPDLDTQSTTAWYLGDFVKQFVEKVVIPFQVLTRRMGDNNEDAWRRDIAASVKARYDSKFGAVDYVFVGKSAGTG